MNKALKIILLTVFFDLVSLGVILPILPFVIQGFGMGAEWVGISFSASSAGMFIGGMIFGRLSDRYGRKRVLSYTVLLNMAGYLLFPVAWNIWIFVFSRFLSGLGMSGISVAQAYISDISKPQERAKNLGFLGAMHGIGFVVGPLLGVAFSGNALQSLGLISATLLFLNALVIWIVLPESKKALEKGEKHETMNPIDFHHNPKILRILFLCTLFVALGFSGNQSLLAVYMYDVFGIKETNMGYVYAFVGLSAVIYQGFGIKHVRKILKERGLVIFGSGLLALSFVIFGLNENLVLAFVCIMLFPIGFGSFQPGNGALIAKYAGNETGKAMGTNISYMSIANIFGPIIGGYAYTHHHSTPYLISALFSLVTIAIVTSFIKKS